MSNPTHVVTGKARLSYVHLTQPYANPNQNSGPNKAEPKYSATILIPKSDTATRQRIDAAIEAASQQGTAKQWNGVRPPRVATPIHDGDGVRPSDGMPFGPECKGHWVFTASSKNAPGIVDANLNPIINSTEIYSGMYARVSIDFFPYNSNGKKGVGCGLGNVQKLEDGEPLGGGRTSAEDDFGDGTPQQYQAPQGQYAPQQYQQAPQQYQQVPQQPQYQQPQYQQYQQAPQQQTPPWEQQQPQIDPITGKPLGGVYGL